LSAEKVCPFTTIMLNLKLLIRDVARMDKGDLYLRFEIEFPKELTSEQKSQLLEVL